MSSVSESAPAFLFSFFRSPSSAVFSPLSSPFPPFPFPLPTPHPFSSTFPFSRKHAIADLWHPWPYTRVQPGSFFFPTFQLPLLITYSNMSYLRAFIQLPRSFPPFTSYLLRPHLRVNYSFIRHVPILASAFHFIFFSTLHLTPIFHFSHSHTWSDQRWRVAPTSRVGAISSPDRTFLGTVSQHLFSDSITTPNSSLPCFFLFSF
ncbi:hypothetical protein BGW80DRAFT_762092 [Lactifluus volemus]|nr:hypothetical protein BGW80DRAFT_762092 [Lactifluus volemus]